MMQRRSASDDHFDLLPFINILMCTLGCLLLIALSIASLSLAEAPEAWVQTGPGNGRTPVLLVWDGKALVGTFDSTPKCVPFTADGTPDAAACPANVPASPFGALQRYFLSVAAKQYALIAVRPSGFASFYGLKRAFTDAKITIGYEPIGQTKNVRLDVKR
jgi:hypothetical protein